MNPHATLAVIGAGPLGRRLAALAAAAGYLTILEDVLPQNLLRAQQHLLPLTAALVGNGPDSVRFAPTIEEAVRTADLIIDCVPDELESKLEIFTLLDRMAPPLAIFGTPTRTLSIADLASCTYRPDRCVAFELPPAFIGAYPTAGRGIVSQPDTEPESVTIITTPQTAANVTVMVTDFWQRLGLAVTLRTDCLALP